MLHLLSITGTSLLFLSHSFQNNEIFMTKKLAHCAPVPGYSGPLGGTQQIY